MAVKARVRKSQRPKKGHAGARAKTAPSPVYFLSLTVENVRCFGPRQMLDLSDGRGRPARWTVILGNNGVGKTTLLQGLAAFEPKRTAIGPNFAKGAYKPAGVDLFGFNYWSPLRQRTSRAELVAKMFSGNLQGSSKGPTREETVDLSMESGIAFSFIKSPFRELICHGYGATRRMGAGALSSSQEKGGSESLFREDVPLRNAEEWLLQADYSARAAKGKLAEVRRDRVKQLLIDLLPDVSDIRFAVPGARSPAAQVEVKTPYGWVTVRGLSLGYRTLIAWMVDLASRMFERYPDSPNPLAEPAVVLVDEIDLHLHPRWQRQLMSYLTERFPATQFIVTAHSPLVVQSALQANIVVLRRDGDHVVIDNDVEAIRGWRVDQVLTSDLFGLESARPPQLDELLKERTQLLSKSRLTAADKARLEQLEEAIGPLPAGETSAEREALDIIQRFASRVREKGE